MDRKNLIIGILVALLVLGSLWGSVGNKNSRVLKQELAKARQQISALQAAANQARSTVLDKTAQVQKQLTQVSDQLKRARQELVALRKTNKSLEARISERDATIQKLKNERDQLMAQCQENNTRQTDELNSELKRLQQALQAKERQLARLDELSAQAADLQEQIQARDKEIAALKAQLAGQNEEADSEDTAVQEEPPVQPQPPATDSDSDQELAEARAQIIGLEKIVEEKNQTIEDLSHELDQVRINMDVLLARIRDLQDSLQEVRDENQELVKELAEKNRRLADIKEQDQGGDAD